MMQGSCLCRTVRWTTSADLTGPSVCHCSQCRRQSGHVWASAQVPEDRLEILGTPTWYRASPTARRGFCGVCGSFLFWQGDGEDMISVALGSIDGPTELRLEKHIFTADKGDYYDIADGLPAQP